MTLLMAKRKMYSNCPPVPINQQKMIKRQLIIEISLSHLFRVSSYCLSIKANLTLLFCTSRLWTCCMSFFLCMSLLTRLMWTWKWKLIFVRSVPQKKTGVLFNKFQLLVLINVQCLQWIMNISCWRHSICSKFVMHDKWAMIRNHSLFIRFGNLSVKIGTSAPFIKFI